MRNLNCKPEIAVALDKFMNEIHAAAVHYRKTHHTSLAPDTYTLQPGRKYIRVVTNGSGVFCFIEKETGNVLKAALWAAPAEGVRGTIMTGKYEDYGVGAYGAYYKRGGNYKTTHKTEGPAFEGMTLVSQVSTDEKECEARWAALLGM